jgi:L-aspartate oxidase
MRDRESLRSAIGPLAALARFGSAAADPALVALMIAVAALRREHSVGAHCRTDFPERPAAPTRSRLTLAEAFADAEAVAPLSLTRQA